MVFLERDTALVAQSLSLPAVHEHCEQWALHLDLLLRWNKAYNLTAIKEPKDVLSHHLADSLSISPYIKAGTVVDVGTGGGFPGIPLAVLYPETQFVLVDTVLKKARFLRQVVAELKLDNVEIHHARVEQLSLSTPASQIVSRAFSSIADFLSLTQNLADPSTEWLAMKGKAPQTELEALQGDLSYTLVPLEVPGLDAERHLVQISRHHDD